VITRRGLIVGALSLRSAQETAEADDLPIVGWLFNRDRAEELIE